MLITQLKVNACAVFYASSHVRMKHRSPLGRDLSTCFDSRTASQRFMARPEMDDAQHAWHGIMDLMSPTYQTSKDTRHSSMAHSLSFQSS